MYARLEQAKVYELYLSPFRCAVLCFVPPPLLCSLLAILLPLPIREQTVILPPAPKIMFRFISLFVFTLYVFDTAVVGQECSPALGTDIHYEDCSAAFHEILTPVLSRISSTQASAPRLFFHTGVHPDEGDWLSGMPRFAINKSCTLAIDIRGTPREKLSNRASVSWAQLSRAMELLIRTCVLEHGYGGSQYAYGLHFAVGLSAKVPQSARVPGSTEASGPKAQTSKDKEPGEVASVSTVSIDSKDEEPGEVISGVNGIN